MSLVGSAAAIPKFPFRGQPSFTTGFWSLTVNGTSKSTGYTLNSLNSVDGYVNSIYSGNGSEPRGLSTFVARADSYQCLDDRTFVLVYNYSLYSLVNNASSPSRGGPEPPVCSLRRVDGDLLRTVSVRLVNDSVGCPTVSDLPAGDTPGIFGSAFILRRVPSSIQTAQVMCVNQSSTTEWTLPLPTAIDPPAFVGKPCASYANTAFPAGPTVTQGNWLTGAGLAMVHDTRLGWSTLSWSPNPAGIATSLGFYTSSQCEGKRKTATDLCYQLMCAVSLIMPFTPRVCCRHRQDGKLCLPPLHQRHRTNLLGVRHPHQ